MRSHDNRVSGMPIRGMTRRLAYAAAAMAVTIFLPGAALAQGSDDLWEVTTKMEMAGMPMAMPPQISRVCSAKNRKGEDYVPKRDNCKMAESNSSGGKVTYKMVCDQLTAAGEITYSADKYEGKTHMTGTMDGHPVDMMQTYSGKRVGDCTAQK